MGRVVWLAVRISLNASFARVRLKFCGHPNSQFFLIFFQIFYFKFFKFLFSRLCLVFVFHRAIRFMRNSFTRNTTVPTFSNGPKPKRQTPNHNLYSQLPNSVLFIQKEIRGNYSGKFTPWIDIPRFDSSVPEITHI